MIVGLLMKKAAHTNTKKSNNRHQTMALIRFEKDTRTKHTDILIVQTNTYAFVCANEYESIDLQCCRFYYTYTQIIPLFILT